MCLLTEFRNTEYLAHIFEGAIRILILDPHSLRCIDRRTAADRYDPVRLELQHRICTLHDCLYRRIRLDTVKDLDFHACFFQIALCLIEESEALHGTASDADHCLLSLEVLQCLKCAFAVINIAR